jgi:hypothetical protein
MKELPTIGDEYTYNGLPCWVIDVANDGAWFGVVQGIRRVDKNMVETDPNYRRNREAVVRRVKRLYKPDFNTVDAWGNLWSGVTCKALKV